MLKKVLTLVAISAIAISSFAHAEFVTTNNLVKNNTFQTVDGNPREAIDWIAISGIQRFAPRVNVPGYVGDSINTFYGDQSDDSRIYQRLNIADEGVSLDLIDTGQVTMDFSFYVGADHGDRDRSRMYVNFFDDNLTLLAHSGTSFFDDPEWTYHGNYDFVVPTASRFMDVTLHHDRIDGLWNSTGIALPNVTLSYQADTTTTTGGGSTNPSGSSVDVPVFGIGAISLLGLLGFRRK